MAQFQQGDVVHLKSGGPWMTITTLGDYSGWTVSPANTALCMWFEGKKKQETVFDVAMLEKVSSRSAAHLLASPSTFPTTPQGARAPETGGMTPRL